MNGAVIKGLARRAIRSALQYDVVWEYLPTRARTEFVQVQRRAALESSFHAKCGLTFGKYEVSGGPFAGMKYPEAIAVGSALYPKLIGSYESELHEPMEILLTATYPLIIDIGFAEGYYLIGIGRRLTESRLIGFDINPAAHRQCQKLARVNGINPKRLDLRSCCPSDELLTMLPLRSLVVCDCESCEAKLFRSELIPLWAKSDLLIECHDFLISGVTEAILASLARSHSVRIIGTQSTESKLHFLRNKQYKQFRLEEKLRLLCEGRPAPQAWIIATAKATVSKTAAGE